MFNLQKLVVESVKRSFRILPTINIFEKSFSSNVKKGKLIDQFISNIAKNSKELPETISKIVNENRINSENFKNKLRAIDQRLVNSEIGKSELLDVLVKICEKIPGQITQLDFFSRSLKNLVDHHKISQLNKDEFVKLVFLLGLLKKDSNGRKYLLDLINSNSQLIDELTTLDFAILCSSLFKASLKLSNPKFHQRVVQEICNSQLEISILVTFIKSFRQNGLKSKEVLEKIEEISKIENLDIEFRSLVHLFAVLAEVRERNPELIKYFLDQGLKSLENQERRTRMKDWAKFLFCCSHLNLQLEENFLEWLENFIERKLNLGEFNNFDHVVDATLSLRILGSRKLLRRVVTHKEFFLTNKENRVKLEARMKLLMLLERIETKNVFPAQLPAPAPKFLISPCLKRLKTLLSENGYKNSSIVQQIPEIRIAGIRVQLGSQSVNLEVLDGSNKLSDSTPTGLFALKIKLLEEIGEKVLVLDCERNEEFLDDIRNSLLLLK